MPRDQVFHTYKLSHGDHPSLISMLTALAYEEPNIQTILITSSFLLLLNIVNSALDSVIYCGLVGQVFLGVFWGTPLSGWLDESLEHATVNLGYLGLILIVYEGGLSTSLKPVVANLGLSIVVASTGILIPIALSFLLGPLANATPLQCFAAGAALSATSLGTTFTILSTAGMATTRLGTVLTSAAMMDDVVGLIILQVVSSLGGSGGVISGAVVGRPVGASLALLVFVVGCGWAARRIALDCSIPQKAKNAVWMGHLGILISLVVVASYAGASPLFAAFLAGSAISWWDASKAGQPQQAQDGVEEVLTGIEAYDRYLQPTVRRILAPLFFASIGFAVPITQMFEASMLWRGVVYALLMVLGKLLTGVWLLRFSVAWPGFRLLLTFGGKARELPAARTSEKGEQSDGSAHTKVEEAMPTGPKLAKEEPDHEARPQPSPSQNQQAKPRSLYPPAILGLAMVARGEVAFLIASVAESKGIYSGPSGSEIYLIVMWAALLTTIIGPLGVGSVVRRVQLLEKRREESGAPGHEAVLGVWGVE